MYQRIYPIVLTKCKKTFDYFNCQLCNKTALYSFTTPIEAQKFEDKIQEMEDNEFCQCWKSFSISEQKEHIFYMIYSEIIAEERMISDIIIKTGTNHSENDEVIKPKSIIQLLNKKSKHKKAVKKLLQKQSDKTTKQACWKTGTMKSKISVLDD